MTLCLPCMIGNNPNENGNQRIFHHRMWNAMQLAFCATFLSWTCTQMFAIEYIQDKVDPDRTRLGLKLIMTKYDCNSILERAVPITTACTLLFTIVTGMRSTIKMKNKKLGSGAHCLVCCLCITMTAMPFADLSPTFHHSGFGRMLSSAAAQNFRRYSRKISHGYGLFRRMTGVGAQPVDAVDNYTGWAGLPPSIVARPEIILEAVIDDSEEWRELNFRWKPGRIDKLPLQVAPHQVSMLEKPFI